MHVERRWGSWSSQEPTYKQDDASYETSVVMRTATRASNKANLGDWGLADSRRGLTCMLMAITSEGLHWGREGLPRYKLIHCEIPFHHIFTTCMPSLVFIQVVKQAYMQVWWYLVVMLAA